MKRRRFKKKIEVQNEDEDMAEDVSKNTAEQVADDSSDLEEPPMSEEEDALELDSPQDEDERTESDSEERNPFAAELNKLYAELDAAKEEAKESYDRYVRSMAELENVKKRAKKERSELLQYGGEGMARELLEVIDSLELALKQRAAEAEPNDFSKGIEMIRDQFASTFERFGIVAVPALGEQFDPETHEAMVSVPTADHEPGTIMEEFKKAYKYRDKLLRPAQVVVASAPEGEQESAEGESEE